MGWSSRMNICLAFLTKHPTPTESINPYYLGSNDIRSRWGLNFIGMEQIMLTNEFMYLI